MVLIKSDKKIELGKNVTIRASRHIKSGSLAVDDEQSIHGESIGFMKSLDLSENLMIGMISGANNGSRIYKNLGLNQGLKGCIWMLKFGDKIVDFNISTTTFNIIQMNAIQECDNHFCSLMASKSGLNLTFDNENGLKNKLSVD